MIRRNAFLAVAAVLVMISAAFVIASDDSDAAGSFGARVFIGDGTESGTKEMSGTGGTVKDIIVGALSSEGHSFELNANGTLKSVDGQKSSDDRPWTIFQWRPPVGWTITYMNSNGNAFLADGTSYYVMQSEAVKGTDGKTTYKVPSMEPVSTGYFFIKFKEDYDVNSYITSTLTEDQRRTGFWISGSGSSLAAAFMDACKKYGFELNMSDGKKGDIVDADYVGWLYSFFGLSDEHKSGDVTTGAWKYWSQFYWDSDTGKWVYSETMGHYDPAVYPYFALVRQTTTEETISIDLGQTPSDAPISKINNGCNVTFVDGDGKKTVVKVPYFGTAKAPSTASKSPTSDVSYVFKGWKGSYTQVISDVTVTAEFDEIRNVKITGVNITDSKDTMPVGTSYVFKASVTPSGASSDDLSWSVSDASVASADGSGKVTAKKEGTVTVTVSVGGFTDSVTLKVTPAVDNVWSVEIKEGDVGVEIGKSRTLTADVQPSNAKDRTVKWSSSDEGIVKVDGSGKITGVSLGTAEITVTTNDGGFTATVKVSVMKSSDNVWTVKIDGGDREAKVGSKISLKAVVEPDTAKNRTVEWSVSDADAASIDASGNLTLKKIGLSGTVEVTARSVDGGISDTITVSITPAAGQAAKVSIGDIAVKIGGSVKLKPVLDKSVTKTDATWTSTDPSVVSVDPKTGEITAKAVGSADITVTMTDGGAEARCTVDVYSDSDVSSISEKNVKTDGEKAEAGVDDDAVDALIRNGSGYTVRTDSLGSVAFTAETLKKLSSDGTNITLTISIFDKAGLSASQKSVVGSGIVYEYLIDGCDVPDLGGKAKVSIPYVLKDGERAKDVRVYCVDPDGSVEAFACSYDESAGLATFETTHFSLYFASADGNGADQGSSGDGSGSGMIFAAIGAVIAIAVVAVIAVRVRGKS